MTTTSPFPTATSTSPCGGENFTALSSRFVTARSSMCGRPSTGDETAVTTIWTFFALARRRTRSAAAWTISVRSVRSTSSGGASSRASSTSSLTSPLSSRIWASTSRNRASRSFAGSARRGLASARNSSSMLVRRLVSGVRSSWLASSTSSRWRARDASSARSMLLRLLASRAISSLPVTGISADRSWVRATSSAAAAAAFTGLRDARAISLPSSTAPATPATPTPSRISPRVRSVLSTSAMGRASWIAPGVRPGTNSRGTVATR